MKKWKFFVIAVALIVIISRDFFSPIERTAAFAGQPQLEKQHKIDDWRMYAGITVYLLVMALLATDKENVQQFSKWKKKIV